MKNFDIFSIGHVRRTRSRNLHGHAIPDLLHAFHDNSLAGLNPLFNNPHRAASLTHLHRSDVDLVVATNNR
jgi:hypothetical protein